MNDEVRISVIIPTLNEEKLLGEMLGQFTPEVIRNHGIELVVSDGGSSDRTPEIARLHAEKVVTDARGIKQTISAGRNVGAAHASGDTFVFLNADTLVPDIDSFFNRIRSELENSALCAITCRVRVYPHEEVLADILFHGFYNWLFRAMNFVGMAMGRGECHVIRRSAFEKVGGYREEIAAGEDYDMFRRLARVGKVRFLNDLLVYESPRRYRKYGYFIVTLSWFLNFLTVFFSGKSILSQWKPVR